MARDNARPVPWWRWCARVLLAVCALAVLIVGVANVVTVATTRDRVVTVEGAATALAGDAADAVVVLGASVYADGTPSDILADRLEVACDLYKSGAARAIIVSGDNRTSRYNESDAMKAYCVELGVPSEDVYVDHAGNTTYESMWRARHVFGADRIIVATQAYHLYPCSLPIVWACRRGACPVTREPTITSGLTASARCSPARRTSTRRFCACPWTRPARRYR